MPKVGQLLSGVYCWLNLTNSKLYVGSTSAFRRRKGDYERELARGECHNRYLQAAWDKYGSEQFEFLVLERCRPSDCKVREQYWIDYYASACREFGYNLNPKASYPTDEVRALIAKRRAGIVVTKEWREKIGYASSHRPPESIEKMRKSLTGKKKSKETKEKLTKSMYEMWERPGHRETVSASSKGHKKSEATRKRMSRAQKLRSLCPIQKEIMRRTAKNARSCRKVERT